MFDANLRELPSATEFAAVLESVGNKSPLAYFFKEGQTVHGIKSESDKRLAALRTNDIDIPWLVVVYDEEDFDNSLVYDHEAPLKTSSKERDYALHLLRTEGLRLLEEMRRQKK